MDTEKPLVLVVDDNAINIDLIVNALNKEYRLGIAKDGLTALRYSEKHHPDLILLDIMMAGMDGYQVCTRLKANPRTRQIPVIFLTAMSQTKDKTRGFQVGAIDYITKPFHLAEVKARVKAHLSHQRVREREIQIAAKIQRELLGTSLPRHIPGVRFARLTQPSQMVDGDFYDFYRIHDRCFDIVLGDVMGKGISAALLGAALKGRFMRTLHELSRRFGTCFTPPIDIIVSTVHGGMIKKLEALEAFATVCYARFDLEIGQLRFIDCGHMRTIHLNRESGTCKLLKGHNMPLGFPETNPFQPAGVALHPGDMFCFYSDGLTEARSMEGQFYGTERLVQFIQTHGDRAPDEIVQALHEDVIAFAGTDLFQDDITCLFVVLDKSLPEKT